MLHLKLINYVLSDQPKDKRGYLIERQHIDSLIQLLNEVYVQGFTPPEVIPAGLEVTDIRLTPEAFAADVVKPWIAESITELTEGKKDNKVVIYHSFSTSLVSWYYYQYNGVDEQLQALQKMLTVPTKEVVTEEDPQQ